MLHVMTASRTLLILLVLLTVVPVSSVHAEQDSWTPVQFAFWNPIQIFDSERSVRGFRYSLLKGVNKDVVGLDLSTFVSEAKGDVIGVQWALIMNKVEGSVWGLQSSVIVNQVEGGFFGLQLSGVNVVSGDMSGVQLAVMGAHTRAGHMRGIQFGAMGSFAEDSTGFQVSFGGNTMKRGRGLQIGGGFNTAESITGVQIAGLMNSVDKDAKGLQIALLNIANDMKGLQLGLINVNKNGFLPVFPLFNFGLSADAIASDGAYVELNLGPSIAEDSDISGGGLSGEVDFDTGFAVGGAVGYRLSNGLRAEGNVSYRETDVDEVTGGGIALDGAGDVSLVTVMANIYYDFDLGSPVKPFIGGGIGVGIIDIDSDDSMNVLVVNDDSVEFAWNIMVGAGYGLTESIDLSFGYRYLGTTDPEFDATLFGISGTLDAEITVHEILFGLRYNL